MGNSPNPQGTPVPVTLASPGEFSDADYVQLGGLTVPEKILQMRGILTEVRATRIPQQLTLAGPFRWDEAVGASGEYLFIGAAPPQLQRHTVVLIMPDGKVYKMYPAGITGLLALGPPKVVGYDLQLGKAQLVVS